MSSSADPSSSATVCATCGSLLGGGRLGEQCPACLFQFAGDWMSGAGEEAPAEAAGSGPAGPRRFGDYELGEEIARGGMGVVYRARQRSLDREVALKMVLGAELADRETQRRLQREAEAAASLHHPHIVPIYEIGEHEQQPYYTMRLVPGGETIAHWARRVRGDHRAVAHAVAQVAWAVSHAHDRAVLHRDLKPSNVLWDPEGGPQVTDFGLAKRLDAPNSSLSLSGGILGSPSYMAPEQAEGRQAEVTTATDVYGIGALLYELLAGVPPFQAETSMATIRRVQAEPPEPPSRRAPGLDRDLETICLKCLEKSPSHRYPSARALAKELERFERGEPIEARRVGPAVHVWRWMRRKPAVAAALAGCLAALVAGILATTWQWRNAESARQGEASARAEATATVSDLFSKSGFTAAREGDPSRAALWFAHAANATADPARRAANRLRWSSWRGETATAVRAFSAGVKPGSQIAWNPAQSALLVQNHQPVSRAEVWEIAREDRWAASPPMMLAAAWMPRSGAVASVEADAVRVREYPSGRERARHALPLLAGPTWHVVASADERWIGVGGPGAWAWEIATDRWIALPAPPAQGGGAQLEFSRDGRRVLLAGEGWCGVCALAAPGQFLFPPVPATRKLGAGFLGAGERLAVLDDGGRLRVLESDTGAEVRAFDLPAPLHDANNRVRQIDRISPDGRFVAMPESRLYDLGAGPRDFPAHTNYHYGNDFTPDGAWLATASADDTVRLWPLPAGAPSELIGWHQEEAACVAISPDQRLVATGQYGDGLVRVWRRARPAARREIPTNGPTWMEASADGEWIVPAGWTDADAIGERTRVHRAANGLPAGPEIAPGGIVMHSAFAPDARWLAIVCSTTPGRATETFAGTFGSGSLQFWDFRSGRRLGAPVDLGVEPRAVAVHPDGSKVVVYGAGRSLFEVERASGTVRTLRAPTPHVGEYESANAHCRYSPDGSTVIAWGRAYPPLLWDPATGRPREAPALAATSAWGVAFHGSTLATVSQAGRIDFTRLPEGTAAAPPIQDRNWLFFAEFDATGSLFLTGGRGKAARVWNVGTGNLDSPALMADDEVFCAVFLAGTRIVVTGSRDGRVCFWDTRGGQQVRSPIFVGGHVKELRLVAGGRRLAVNRQQGSSGSGIYVLDLAALLEEPSLSPEETVQLAEIDAAAAVRSATLEPLNASEWMTRWRAFRTRRPDWHDARLRGE